MIATARIRVQRGFLMLEVMIALFILLIGLVGLAGLQARAQQAETESYQRIQALVLLRDMGDRINANRSAAASYMTDGTATPTIASGPLGTGGNSNINCTAPANTAALDLCQWHQALLGAAETSGGSNVGAMPNARGCITSPAANTYLIEVAWQGTASTAAPPGTCGSGSYGDESMRREVITIVQIGNLN